MKKYIVFLAALMLAIGSSITLTGCGGDAPAPTTPPAGGGGDDDNGGGGDDDNTTEIDK